MQRRITAKREQIDFLHVEIQQLEETVEKLELVDCFAYKLKRIWHQNTAFGRSADAPCFCVHACVSVCSVSQDKHQQALEVQRQTQELMSEREIRRTLEAEVKASQSQERELKGKADKLEAALYKVSY